MEGILSPILPWDLWLLSVLFLHTAYLSLHNDYKIYGFFFLGSGSQLNGLWSGSMLVWAGSGTVARKGTWQPCLLWKNTVFYKTIKELNYTHITPLFRALFSTLILLTTSDIVGTQNKWFAPSILWKKSSKTQNGIFAAQKSKMHMHALTHLRLWEHCTPSWDSAQRPPLM